MVQSYPIPQHCKQVQREIDRFESFAVACQSACLPTIWWWSYGLIFFCQGRFMNHQVHKLSTNKHIIFISTYHVLNLLVCLHNQEFLFNRTKILTLKNMILKCIFLKIMSHLIIKLSYKCKNSRALKFPLFSFI